jgi:hypothetical protein
MRYSAVYFSSLFRNHFPSRPCRACRRHATAMIIILLFRLIFFTFDSAAACAVDAARHAARVAATPSLPIYQIFHFLIDGYAPSLFFTISFHDIEFFFMPASLSRQRRHFITLFSTRLVFLSFFSVAPATILLEMPRFSAIIDAGAAQELMLMSIADMPFADTLATPTRFTPPFRHDAEMILLTCRSHDARRLLRRRLL